MKILRIIFLIISIATASNCIAVNPSDTVTVADTVTGKSEKLSIIDKVIRYFDDSNKEPSNKKIDFSLIGGPSYSGDTKLSVAILGAALYRSGNDTLSPYSNASVYAQGAITGFYQFGIRGSHISEGSRWRLPYDVSFESYPTYFWGIGYESDKEDDNKTKFKQLSSEVKASFEWQLAKDLYFGPAGHFRYTKAADIDDWSRTDAAGNSVNALSLWQGEELRVLNLGVGFNFTYDTRDFLTNAYEGIYIGIEQRFFPGGVLNDKFFGSTEFTVNKYNRVWSGGVLAMQAHGHFTYGHTPWSMLASFGGSRSMRGYYKARYRDKCEADITVELRQHIWRRNSAVVWVGAGNVFPDFKHFRTGHTLPNYGIGYRWEFKKRTNVRVDFGFGKGCSGLEFNISEVF